MTHPPPVDVADAYLIHRLREVRASSLAHKRVARLMRTASL
jgi:hypothetical protein